MKFKSLITIALMMIVALLAATQSFHAAYVVLFIGLAILSDWSQASKPVFRSNIIASDLQITRVLDNALIGLKQVLMPLNVFSTAYTNIPVGNESGGNSVTVPVYSYTSGDVKDRTPGTDYRTLVSNTQTQARKVVIDQEKVVGISFTNEEAQDQIAFDPVMHGLIKGRDLAQTVLNDIFSVVRHGRFNSRSIAPVSSSSFDASDVADLGQICMEDGWGQLPQPGLVLNPALHFNLLKQNNIIDAASFGSDSAIRQARINDILGFAEAGTPALSMNNGPGKTFTAAATDIITSVAHGYLTGDQVQVSSAGTLPAGLAAATYYYVIVLTNDTFKLASTQANAKAGTAVDITDAGTGTHTVALKTNLIGFAGHPSAIITAFRPVIPTPGIRQKLINFELVEDSETKLTMEYRHIADENTGQEYQLIGCRYGKQYGIADALKIISAAAA